MCVGCKAQEMSWYTHTCTHTVHTYVSFSLLKVMAMKAKISMSWCT